ncbi:MAG: ABC transporter permease [Bacteroidales bacterium]
MNKTFLILKREYITRVKKPSFIIMTFLGPLLMAALMVVPIFLATMSDSGIKKIAVLDETEWFAGKFENDNDFQFEYVDKQLDSVKSSVLKGDYDAFVYIPKPELNIPVNAMLFSSKQASLSMKSYIRNTIKTEVENRKLIASGIDPEVIKSSKTNINIQTIRLEENGEESKSYTEVDVALGLISSILIYFFIFMFGAQVMRGVIEEKTSRIIEVIVSSVKPFQLMMGKIVGIALVGLTQFLLWVLLTLGIYTIVSAIFGPETVNQIQTGNGMMGQIPNSAQLAGNQQVSEIFDIIRSIDFGVIIFSFIVYFIAGYLLYAALFAAIGSAVDNEADTQQFMLPVSAPLILGMVLSNFVVNNPDGGIAFWLSMFPLTSPVIMMVRIPFGVPYWQIGLSMGILVLGFLFTTWLAAKIYRTGILMYGKKISYKELWKWLKYRS